MNNQETCNKCKFGDKLNGAQVKCRRNAPVLTSGNRAGFPIMSIVDWCGEFKPITECQHETLKAKLALNAYDSVEEIVCDKCGVAVMPDIYKKD